MSVMILDTQTIEKLGNSYIWIKNAMYENTNLNEIETTLKIAYKLNIRSWNERYIDDIVTEDKQEIFYKPDFSNCKEKYYNIYEVLKALQCLRYNIEVEKMNKMEQRSIEKLSLWIDRIKDFIIENNEQYKAAQWG